MAQTESVLTPAKYNLQLKDLVLWVLCALRLQGIKRIELGSLRSNTFRRRFDSFFANICLELGARKDIELSFVVDLEEPYGDSNNISEALAYLASKKIFLVVVDGRAVWLELPDEDYALGILGSERKIGSAAAWPSYFCQNDPSYWQSLAIRLVLCLKGK